jgi:hypothetical protein
MAAQFDREAAWQRVSNARELGECWRRWLDDPPAARELGQRGRRLLDENRGALARTMEVLAPVLAATAARSTTRPPNTPNTAGGTAAGGTADPGSAAAAGA